MSDNEQETKEGGPMQLRPFQQWEVDDVTKLVEEKDYDLDATLETNDDDDVKDNRFYSDLENSVSLTPLKDPYMMTVTMKTYASVPQMIQDVLDKLNVPCRVNIDFFFTCRTYKSANIKLVYPSRGTTSNKKEYLTNQDDIDELAQEYEELPLEKIVNQHTGTRLNDPLNERSGYSIHQILAIRLYCQSWEYFIYS